jgi:chromosome segregation ATPase
MSGVNQHVLGNVSFSPARPLPQAIADEVMDQMADSIVTLTHELEEANARIAVLEEERNILVKRPLQRLARIMMEFDLATGHGDTLDELLTALREELADKWRWFDSEVTHARNERDEARVQYRSTELLGMALAKTINEMKEERADLKAEIESLRDQLCADKCRDKAAADGGWANI